MVHIGNSWDDVLQDVFARPSYQKLRRFLLTEYRTHTIYPPADQIFHALELTPFEAVKVCILGQDPYHEEGQAQGLAFSVPEGVTLPPSLRNIFRELADEKDALDALIKKTAVSAWSSTEGAGEQTECDILSATLTDGTEGASFAERNGGQEAPLTEERDALPSGDLTRWAKQGVLLLNTCLSVRAHQANAHKGKGWEEVTDAIISRLCARERPLVFILWGAHARAKKALIDADRHLVLEGAHPSPFSAYNGFFGGNYFVRANAFLLERGQTPIRW